MALVEKHRAQYQWYQYAYKTWAYEIPRPDMYAHDVIRVGYSSVLDAWAIFINHIDMGQAPTLDEAKTLAIMLYKLHPDLHRDSDPRIPKFK